MPKPSAAATFEGVPQATQLSKRGRPRVVENDTATGATLARTLNTQILNPLYTRVEALEKRAYIEVKVTTPTPYTGLFPLIIPAPSFVVQHLSLAYIRNNTTNGAALTTVPAVQWDYSDGGALLVTAMTLSDATNYTIRFKAEG